jgi:hypothetical protein
VPGTRGQPRSRSGGRSGGGCGSWPCRALEAATQQRRRSASVAPVLREPRTQEGNGFLLNGTWHHPTPQGGARGTKLQGPGVRAAGGGQGAWNWPGRAFEAPGWFGGACESRPLTRPVSFWKRSEQKAKKVRPQNKAQNRPAVIR